MFFLSSGPSRCSITVIFSRRWILPDSIGHGSQRGTSTSDRVCEDVDGVPVTTRTRVPETSSASLQGTRQLYSNPVSCILRTEASLHHTRPLSLRVGAVSMCAFRLRAAVDAHVGLGALVVFDVIILASNAHGACILCMPPPTCASCIQGHRKRSCVVA